MIIAKVVTKRVVNAIANSVYICIFGTAKMFIIGVKEDQFVQIKNIEFVQNYKVLATFPCGKLLKSRQDSFIFFELDGETRIGNIAVPHYWTFITNKYTGVAVVEPYSIKIYMGEYFWSTPCDHNIIEGQFVIGSHSDYQMKECARNFKHDVEIRAGMMNAEIKYLASNIETSRGIEMKDKQIEYLLQAKMLSYC